MSREIQLRKEREIKRVRSSVSSAFSGTESHSKPSNMSEEIQPRKEREAMMDARVSLDDLPSDILPNIAKYLHSHIDFLRFRSVCKSWRSSISPSLPNTPSSFPFRIPHPFNPFNHLSLTLSTFYRIQRFPSFPKGRLVRVEQKSDLCVVDPLSPLSSSPRIFNLLDYQVVEIHKSYSFKNFGRPIKKVVFFPTSCWSDVEDSVVCFICGEGNLALFKRGENKWTLVDDVNLHYDDVILYKGQFYVTDRWGTISWIDTRSMKLIQYSPPLCGFGHQKHLVESCGNLYVVDRYYDTDYGASVVNFKVYRLDEEWGTWVDVKDLRDRVFMLGDRASFSVCANDFDGYVGNCIFFTDNFGVRVYNLGDGNIITLELDDPFNSRLFCWPPPS